MDTWWSSSSMHYSGSQMGNTCPRRKIQRQSKKSNKPPLFFSFLCKCIFIYSHTLFSYLYCYLFGLKGFLRLVWCSYWLHFDYCYLHWGMATMVEKSWKCTNVPIHGEGQYPFSYCYIPFHTHWFVTPQILSNNSFRILLIAKVGERRRRRRNLKSLCFVFSRNGRTMDIGPPFKYNRVLELWKWKIFKIKRSGRIWKQRQRYRLNSLFIVIYFLQLSVL